MFSIHNVRFGFATNSSSSHSLIFLPPGSASPNSYGREFGWDEFQLTDRVSKMEYLGVMIRDQVFGGYGADVGRMVMRDVFGDIGESLIRPSGKGSYDNWADGGYVDHQSVWSLPVDYASGKPSVQFLRDIRDFMSQEDLVVRGGNDNSDSSFAEEGFNFPFKDSGPWIARKDLSGYWSLFSGNNGAKVRLTFGDKEQMTPKPEKAGAPELVDLKITDWCNFGCTYCYQDSTLQGKHAKFSDIQCMIDVLHKLQVFEVAIGGGEPTAHPDFMKILTTFREKGIVPNFSTKSLEFLKKVDRESFFKLIGGFAYSLPDQDPRRHLASFLAQRKAWEGEPGTYWEHANKAQLQVVWGTLEADDMEFVLRECKEHSVPVTLLGYKTVGRGGQFTLKDIGSPIEMLQKVEMYWGAGIDTALALQYTGDLARARVSPKLYETTEGRFSCYIDLVDKKMGASSFVPRESMDVLTDGTYQWEKEVLEHFATYH